MVIVNGKTKLAEEIVELIENRYPEAKNARLIEEPNQPEAATAKRAEAEYRYFESLFFRNFNSEEITQETVQEVIEELESGNFLKLDGGIAISALLNLSSEENIEIEVKRPWNYLGMYNQKNIDIEGNVGNFLGKNMHKGKISVNGNAEHYVGERMEGGRIVVNGKVEYCAGRCMLGGELWVEGDAGWNLGISMKGGIVVVDGDAGDGIARNMMGGKIWVKNLRVEKLSHEIGIGSIYRGLPGEDSEPIRVFEILKKPKHGYVFFYFDKRKEKGNFLDRAIDVLIEVFEAYNSLQTSEGE